MAVGSLPGRDLLCRFIPSEDDYGMKNDVLSRYFGGCGKNMMGKPVYICRLGNAWEGTKGEKKLSVPIDTKLEVVGCCLRKE